MASEKLKAVEQIVQEQLNAQPLEELTSPWNSPLFVIKKSGKWRMGTGLRTINNNNNKSTLGQEVESATS